MIAGHLQSLGCELHLQRFFLRPYMQPIAGLFFLLAGALCFVLASKRRYWAALAVALVIPAVYVAEFEFNVPIVTWAGGRDGVNIVADFLPADNPIEKHITFSAHYDSKTDIFDHEQRKPIYGFAPIAMGCLLAASMLGIVSSGRRWGPGAHRVCLALACVGVSGLVMLALAFGGGLLVPAGRQSPGARDDASAVAVLLATADQIAADHQQLKRTAVRFVFFGGEEVNMQGSSAYSRSLAGSGEGFDRGVVVNCEFIGGEEPFCYWESSGTFLSKFRASDEAVQLYQDALTSMGLAPAISAGSIFDDTGRLLAAGFRAVTVGHADPVSSAGYHSQSDSARQVVPARLEETQSVFLRMITMTDRTKESL
jgi:hypothetical protein